MNDFRNVLTRKKFRTFYIKFFHLILNVYATSFSFFFWHAPLGVRNAIRRHQPAQRAVLSQIDCFVQCKIVGSQVSLDSVQPRDTGAPWWSLPVLWWRSRWDHLGICIIIHTCNVPKYGKTTWLDYLYKVRLLGYPPHCEHIGAIWFQAAFSSRGPTIDQEHQSWVHPPWWLPRKIGMIQVLYNFCFVGIEMRWLLCYCYCLTRKHVTKMKYRQHSPLINTAFCWQAAVSWRDRATRHCVSVNFVNRWTTVAFEKATRSEMTLFDRSHITSYRRSVVTTSLYYCFYRIRIT